jgi:hypothetical protein
LDILDLQTTADILIMTSNTLIPGTKPFVSSTESANTVSLSTTASGPSRSTFLTSTTSTLSATTSTQTPYSQPPPDQYHLNPANYIVVPILGISAALIAGIGYIIWRRRVAQREKKRVREEKMVERHRERDIQRTRDRLRELRNKSKSGNTEEVAGWGVASVAG